MASFRTRRRLFWVWTGIVAAYFLWEAAGYRGIYAKLAEWQLKHFHGYVPMLTLSGLVLICTVPIAFLMRRQWRRRIAKEAVRAHDRKATVRLGVRFMRVFFVLSGVAAATAISLLGYGYLGMPDGSGPVRRIAIGDRAKSAPEDGATRLDGIVSGKVIARFGQNWPGAGRDMVFVPVFAKAGERVVHYFVELTPDEYERDRPVLPSGSRNGILVRGGVPGTIKVLYVSAGYPVATDYRTLYASVHSIRQRYHVMAVQLAIVALLFAAAGLWQRRHVRRMRGERQIEAEPALA